MQGGHVLDQEPLRNHQPQETYLMKGQQGESGSPFSPFSYCDWIMAEVVLLRKGLWAALKEAGQYDIHSHLEIWEKL